MKINALKRVMKGVQVTDFSKITFPKLASPKMDGFRCVASDIARTTTMREFPNRHIHKMFKGLLPKAVLLDGELIVGKRKGEGVLPRTSSGVTSEDGKPDWRFWVFDAPRPGVSYQNRYGLAKQLVKSLDNPRVRIVKQKMIHNLDELQEYLEWALAEGFEGIMIRDPDGPYKEGKSTMREQWLLKIKPFETREARITDYFEEMENTNEAIKDATGKSKRSSAKAGKVPKGSLGGFIGLDLESGVEVRVGGGFTAKQRKEFWRQLKRGELIGDVFTYKKQVVGEKDKPRHTSFVALRPEWDIEK